MGRQIGDPEFYCNCPVCMIRFGFSVIHAQLDSAAYAAGTIDSLLERHFPSPWFRELRRETLRCLEGMEDSLVASRRLKRRLSLLTRGGCSTFGVKTLRHPHTFPRPLRSH